MVSQGETGKTGGTRHLDSFHHEREDLVALEHDFRAADLGEHPDGVDDVGRYVRVRVLELWQHRLQHLGDAQRRTSASPRP